MKTYSKFLTDFFAKHNGQVPLEISVLWYCLDMDTTEYLSMNIHERINFKQSYF